MHIPDILEILQKYERILLVSHKNPDADTFGSHIALASALQSIGKKVLGYCASPIPESFRFLYIPHQVTSDMRACAAFLPQAMIVFDSSDMRYAGCDALAELLPPHLLIVNIDHHESNTLFGDVQIVDTEASSTAEIVFHLLKESRLAVSPDMASALLAGIVMDTSRFTNPGTTASSLASAADLLRAGADYSTILKTANKRPLARLKFWGTVLSNIHYNASSGFACAVLKQDDMKAHQANDEDCEGLANFLIHSLAGSTRGVVVLREQEDGTIKGSFRTVDPLLNVEKIAKMVGVSGGGGHKKAAGFTLRGTIQKTPSGFQVA